MHLFLKLNGYDLVASPEDEYEIIISVAVSDSSEDELALVDQEKLGSDNKLSPRNSKLIQKLRCFDEPFVLSSSLRYFV